MFEYVANRGYTELKDYDTALPVVFRSRAKNDEFTPQSVDTFVKRVAFNFYYRGKDVRVNPDTGEETLVWRLVEIMDITCRDYYARRL